MNLSFIRLTLLLLSIKTFYSSENNPEYYLGVADLYFEEVETFNNQNLDKKLSIINNFHAIFETATPMIQKEMAMRIVFKNKTSDNNFADYPIAPQIEKFTSNRKRYIESFLIALNALKNYSIDKILLDSNNDYIKNIASYLTWIVYSIEPDDELLYRIKKIKENLSFKDTKIKQFLIFFSIYNVQEKLFSEQNKTVHNDVLKNLMQYYTDHRLDDGTVTTYINFIRDITWQNSQILYDIEKQKQLLITLSLSRHFYGDGKLLFFAKAPDGDCGNYILGVYQCNSKNRYGKIKASDFLLCLEKEIATDLAKKLYPKLSHIKEKNAIIKEPKEKTPTQ